MPLFLSPCRGVKRDETAQFQSKIYEPNKAVAEVSRGHHSGLFELVNTGDKPYSISDKPLDEIFPAQVQLYAAANDQEVTYLLGTENPLGAPFIAKLCVNNDKLQGETRCFSGSASFCAFWNNNLASWDASRWPKLLKFVSLLRSHTCFTEKPHAAIYKVNDLFFVINLRLKNQPQRP